MTKKIILNKIPYFVYVLPLMSINVFGGGDGGSTPFYESGLIAIWSLVFYIKKFIFPFKLLPFYKIPALTPDHPTLMLSLILFLGVLSGIICFRQKKWLLFLTLFFVLSLFTHYKFELGDGISLVADRFLYLPSLALCLGFGILLARWIGQGPPLAKMIIGILIVIIFILLGIKTHSQVKTWKNDSTLWTDAIQATTSNHLYYINRGWSLASRGQLDLALKDFQAVLNQQPDYVRTLCDIGEIHLMAGKLAEALNDLNKTLEIDPQYAWAYYLRAQYYHSQNKLNLALTDYAQAIQWAPKGYYEMYNDRGKLYEDKKKYTLALNDYNKAIRLNPYFPLAYYNRGNMHLMRKNFDKAIKDYNECLLLDPNYVNAYFNRGTAYFQQNNKDKALKDFDKAMGLGHAQAKEFIKLITKESK